MFGIFCGLLCNESCQLIRFSALITSRPMLLYGCGALLETILYMLRDCSKAKHVWHKLKLDFHIDPYEDDINLLFKMHATSHHNTYFLIGCWIIWKYRNEGFSHINHLLWYIFSQIYSLLTPLKRFLVVHLLSIILGLFIATPSRECD